MTDNLAAFMYVRGLVDENMPLEEIKSHAELVRQSLCKLKQDLLALSDDALEEEVQAVYYEAGKLHFKDRLRWWFQVLYQLMLQEAEGPRLGQFTKLMSICWVTDKIDAVLDDYWAHKRAFYHGY